ncbi:helix-turn-helix domain-containing protein [Curvibacter sp. APW13]|uniref:helix-turn-helix domain-containing protein n=1 Tax=Curvibacter sp. APW13 TaxID=3077236 RepID=UPI0028DDF0A4|nr:helix-turn-helix domain-containing protein [Curvibacter sp. APW13]MDT8989929.1 helix-turn-helix domain-containing protein [Curvibacter sp. APW13]
MQTPQNRAPRRQQALSPRRVAVLAFDRISPFHLCVPSIALGEASAFFDVRVVAMEAGPLRTTAGFTITTEWGLELLDLADVVIVPTWRDVHEVVPEPVLRALRAAHARGAVLVGLCLGAFVLAQAGLLDARQATTHWAYAAELERRYPAVQVDASVLYVQDGTVLTSAGTAAALDCCLHLLRSTAGAGAANHAARMLVLAPHRHGGQAQFIECAVPPLQARSERMGQLLDALLADLDQTPSLDALAQQLHMSRRTFSRQFRAATGMALGPWLAQQRLGRAQQLLERTDASMESIAAQCGLGSAQNLRLQFRKVLGLTPQQWRRQFRG